MPITRTFLDWNRPALPAVADLLIENGSASGTVDLTGVVIVVPGRRAGRRLLEILVDRCETSDRRLTPPVITTVGRLPELLYESKKPFATELVQQLAWVHALRSIDPESASRVVPRLPEDHDTEAWMALGEMLSRQHRELAADGLDFSDVVRQGPQVEGFDEQSRWEILRQIQERYLDTLDDLELWDLQTARLFAIDHHECRIDGEILLVGTVDMNRALRQMLDQVADQVTAVIHAPQQLANRFDEHGCLVPDAWQDVPMDLETKQVRVVDGPAEQAEEVARVIAEFDARYRADEITIGMPEESLGSLIQRRLAQLDVPSRSAVARSLPETGPYQLLLCVADYLETRGFSEFAAFVRHPDVSAWIGEQSLASLNLGDDRSWLQELDDYYNNHLQPQLGNWLGNPDSHARIREVHGCIETLLAPLTREPARIAEWTEPVVELLLNVYGHLQLDTDDETDRIVVAACRSIHDALGEQSAVPDSVSPFVTAAEAIRLTLRQLGNAGIAPQPDEDAVELLGWLELPLDDAPVSVVTTFNEPFVPSSLNAHRFLPNSLRKHLGMDDNGRRYGRDAYALSVLLASRENLTLIVARRDSRNEPLRPSRLLFAADSKSIPQRVLAFFKPEAQPPRAPLAGAWTATRDTSAFIIPRPEPLPEPVPRISVTAFRTYLACPYRFYLRHVLRLEPQDDEARELDARLFGNLIHDVLSDFGQSEISDSQDAQQIVEFLQDRLKRRTVRAFGSTYPAAVEIQLLQLEDRLTAFAEWQAEWSAEGWRIVHSERSFTDDGVQLTVDEERTIQLTGRIDRIDRLGEEDVWAIFDYKTGNKDESPNKTHRTGSGEWLDLQLPLYRHLAKHIGIEGDVRLGYIVLPRDTQAVGERLADWTDEDFTDADETAKRIARSILNEEFWPLQDVDELYFSEFAAICQTGVMDREVV